MRYFTIPRNTSTETMMPTKKYRSITDRMMWNIQPTSQREASYEHRNDMSAPAIR